MPKTSTILYGIKTCDTVKRARRMLDAQAISHKYHDFRQDGLPEAKILYWLEHVTPEELINRRGTTWRKLSDEEQSLPDIQATVRLLLEHPSLIKRPVIEHGNTVRLGFAKKDLPGLLDWLKS